jgi:hypothetical protein
VPRRKASQEKIVRIRLPSIQRKNSANEQEMKIIEKIRESREKSRDYSRGKSREGSRIRSRPKTRERSNDNTRSETPERRELASHRITRKG